MGNIPTLCRGRVDHFHDFRGAGNLPANTLSSVSSRFWEKPSAERAAKLQRDGCLWNTFITIGLAGAFLGTLQSSVPDLLRSLEKESALDDLGKLYADLPALDFSRSVLSNVPERLLVVKDQESGWTDLGNPRRVMDMLARNSIRPAWLSSAQIDFAISA